MGGASRKKPEKLAAKLTEIRSQLELSQNDLVHHLGLKGELTQSHISAFERGVRIPSLVVLLRYARSSGINVENLIDDKLALREGIKEK